MRNVPSEIARIIQVANELASTGHANALTRELIAAAFALDRMDFIPHGYSVVEAWERLGSWQAHVWEIKHNYSDLLVPW